MRPQQLTNLLKCSICHGLYRFAHTIIECGHTFCQYCIFTYIKSFKGRNPSIKCPQCNAQIDPNYSRSIMKDIFKQNLVDVLEPNYLIEEEIIISRVKKLFPEEDLQFLLDEFKYSEYQFQTKRKKNMEKNEIMGKLVQKIKTQLNMSFEIFVQQISSEQKFNQFLEMVSKKAKKQKLLQIRPKSQRQQQYVGINHKMKSEGLTAKKLVRFIEKKALEKIKNFGEQTLKLFLNAQKTRIQIRIQLQCENKRLPEQTDLSNYSEPLYYVLL